VVETCKWSFRKAAEGGQPAGEAFAWLRDGTEPEPDLPAWYVLERDGELGQCFEDMMAWLRDDWEPPFRYGINE
jgi:hypothetical protein